MRVAFDVSPLDRPFATGVEKATLQLLRALAAREHGHEILLVAPRRPRLLFRGLPPGGDADLPFDDPRLRFLHVPGRPRWWRQRAARAVRENGVALWHAPVQAIPFRLPVPRIMTLHELSWMHAEQVEDEGSPWRRALTTRLYASRAARVVCVSATTERDLLALQPELAGRTRVVRHGVDPRFFAAAPDARAVAAACGMTTAQPYVLCVGRALRRKGLDLAIRALAEMPDELVLVLAGVHNDELARALRWARRLGLEGRVRAPGHVPEALLPALYAGAAAFVFPSRSEGFGLPVLEAMAAGCPVVANDRAAVPEVTGDGGVLVDFGQPRAVAAAVARVRTEREHWADRGRARARQFDLDAPARAVLGLWEELAS